MSTKDDSNQMRVGLIHYEIERFDDKEINI